MWNIRVQKYSSMVRKESVQFSTNGWVLSAWRVCEGLEVDRTFLPEGEAHLLVGGGHSTVDAQGCVCRDDMRYEMS